MPRLNRRHFLQLATAAAVTPSLRAQTPTRATLTLGDKPLSTMPLDFTGLSYESPQLANPAFFSPANTELVQLFRELGPTGGVLRLGGNLSAFTAWHQDPNAPITPAEQAFLDKGKRYWEWELTDLTVRRGDHQAVLTPASIQTLAGFLEATGWRLLYGLNFGTGTPQQAAAEAACVQRLCGKNLLAFQLGNELDYWTGSLRPRSGPGAWNFDSYYKQWLEWVGVIRTSAPNAPMGGPDVAENLDWMEQLAQRQGKDLAVLSKHHYVMGPAGDPTMDAHRLLAPDPAVPKEIASAQRAKAVAGVGFRTAECGSCFHGGQPGVSNAFASALWAADYMLTLAHGGHAGLNMHGGGDGIYSPITGDAGRGFLRQPVYFGMKFAQLFAGATFLEATLAATNANVAAYAARRSHDTLIAFINKDAAPLDLDVPKSVLAGATLAEAWRLTAPALDSATGIVLAQTPLAGTHSTLVHLPAYSALCLRYR